MSRFHTSLLPTRSKNKTGELPLAKEFVPWNFRQELDTLFHRFFGEKMFPFTEDFGVPYPIWIRDFDVSDNDKEYVVKLELPGFEPSELDVVLNNNLLTIKAEKNEPENVYEPFRRTLMLPFTDVEPNKFRAIYRNGVLCVYIPKPEGVKVKHIPVKAE